MATILITGANRGIGLELVRQYQTRGDDVVGVCRSTNTHLDASGARVIDGVDVSTEAGISRLSEALRYTPIDVLINNAGILRPDTLNAVDAENMLEHFRVNTLGPLLVTQALVGNLREGSKVGIVTSRVGSIEDNSSGNHYGYRTSKTAVNMVGTNLHHDLSPQGIAVLLLHPGHVQTDMTGGTGATTPVEAAAGLIARLDELSLETSGGFKHAEGYDLPW
ncbi:MAG: SDR family oxidoreductase [Woeseiaceae bacterium]|nr:SDR family oxidoreductase [Woeseiaceae bacterium]